MTLFLVSRCLFVVDACRRIFYSFIVAFQVHKLYAMRSNAWAILDVIDFERNFSLPILCGLESQGGHLNYADSFLIDDIVFVCTLHGITIYHVHIDDMCKLNI